MNSKNCVTWITGPSKSGKTTLPTIITREIRKKQSVIMLNGGELRDILDVTLLHS
jgi:adenylylsulfate kinase-like enzyme